MGLLAGLAASGRSHGDRSLHACIDLLDVLFPK